MSKPVDDDEQRTAIAGDTDGPPGMINPPHGGRTGTANAADTPPPTMINPPHGGRLSGLLEAVGHMAWLAPGDKRIDGTPAVQNRFQTVGDLLLRYGDQRGPMALLLLNDPDTPASVCWELLPLADAVRLGAPEYMLTEATLEAFLRARVREGADHELELDGEVFHLSALCQRDGTHVATLTVAA